MTTSSSHLTSGALLRTGVLALALLTLWSCSQRDDSTAPALISNPDLVFVDVTVIDGTGGPALPHQTVVVSGSRIVRVAATDEVDPAALAEAGARVVAEPGSFLIPGLWDAHAHSFASASSLELNLLHGVTSIRDMGCDPDCTETLRQHRDNYLAGTGTGPRIVLAGPNLDGPLSPIEYSGHIKVTDQTAGTQVAQLKASGSDLIKVRDWLTAEEHESILEAAREHGLPVDGHVAVAVPMLEALGNGQRTVEHSGSVLAGVLLAASTEEEALRAEMLAAMATAKASSQPFLAFVKALQEPWLNRINRSFDPGKADALVHAFLNSGTAFVPTLAVQDPSLRSGDPVFDNQPLRESPRMRFVPSAVAQTWEAFELGLGPSDQDAYVENQQLLRNIVRRMSRAGVPILAGTDAAFLAEAPWLVPGDAVHDELLLLVGSGLSESQAIAAATSVPAKVLGVAELGTVSEGQIADLVLLEADPLADIRNTRKITSVVSSGRFIDSAQLAQRLEALAEEAASQ